MFSPLIMRRFARLAFSIVLVAILLAPGFVNPSREAEARNIWIGWFRGYGGYACGDWAFEYPVGNAEIRIFKLYSKARSYGGSGQSGWQVDYHRVAEFIPSRDTYVYSNFGPSGYRSLSTNTGQVDHYSNIVSVQVDGKNTYVEHAIDILPDFNNIRHRYYWSDTGGGCIF